MEGQILPTLDVEVHCIQWIMTAVKFDIRTYGEHPKCVYQIHTSKYVKCQRR